VADPKNIGKYEIIEEIGRGGFAVVYKARDPGLDRVVALKVLAPHLTWDPSFAERFQREAQATANLRHSHIVTIHEVGQDGEQLYIAMEYLPGCILQELLKAGGIMPLDRALAILEQVADALDYAHGQGAIHRDVKPSNVMVEETARGIRATLMDFGLVKALESSESLTSAGTILGSPEYMAPEQADPDRKSEIGPATDRYALGVVAYQMLTGRVPFDADSPLAVMRGHADKAPPHPQEVRKDLPEGIARVLLKALAKAPGERHPTARTMVEALRQTESDTLALEEKEAAKRQRRLAPRRFPLWVWGAAGALLLALLVVGVLSGPWFRGKTAPKPTVTTAVAVKATDTPVGTDTPVAVPTATGTQPVTIGPIKTPTPTDTPYPMPTPTLAAGATRVWELDDSVMVYVPAGKFWMGSSDEDINAILAECSDCKREEYEHEQPQHEVYIDAFWIDRTEVTNAQYRRCVEDRACTPPQSSKSYTRDSYYGNPDFDDYPVIWVNWHQANVCCRWAGKRLPTEAEWEKAARGTNKRTYPWGEGIDCGRANFDGCMGDTAAVGSYPSTVSPYGALDMAGSVWEWVADWYGGSSYYANSPGRNPQGPESGKRRVVRGGSWYNYQWVVRAAYRDVHEPSSAHHNVGFRCARSDSGP
jgi:formylglycine-generating enzyme required for sulfatase activity